jgi:hypothetical protein
MRAAFLANLALTFQRAVSVGPPHRIDGRMRERAWLWFSEAQQMGLVLQ